LNETENNGGQKKDDDEGDESYNLWLVDSCLSDQIVAKGEIFQNLKQDKENDKVI